MLDEKQREIIENSLWIVDVALSKQNIQDDEDMRQEAAMYLCKCLERFDGSKGVKWTTYAFKSVYLFLKRKKNTQTKRIYKEICCESLPEPLHDELCLNEINNAEYIVNTVCSPLERFIIDLREKGYNGAEIGAITKRSVKEIYRCLQRIRRKIQTEQQCITNTPPY